MPPEKQKNRVAIGGLRGIALAILAVVGVETADVLGNTRDLPDGLAPILAVVVLALRVGEAALDQLRKGDEHNRNSLGL
jgi:hypothetical protein